MLASEFLQALFQSKPDHHFILICEKVGTAFLSSFTQTVDAATKIVNDLEAKGSSDIYIGCGTREKNFGRNQRGLMDDVFGIPALWLDVDVNTTEDDHVHKNNPKSFEEAKKLIATFPLEPSIIINSGHGYHCWWLFDNFWTFENDSHRRIAAEMLKDFQNVMQANAKRMNLHLDSTFDLPRVLRIPGTTNRKHEPHVHVERDGGCDKRYSILDATVALKEAKDSLGSDFVVQHIASITTPKNSGQYKIDPDAMPPQLKLQALMDTNDKFVATWRMQRRDMRDGSKSAYDYSMINFALHHGWEDQEAIDLVMAFRKHNNLPSITRERYFITALSKVKAGLARDDAFDQIDEVIHEIQDDETMPKKQKEQHLKNQISTLIGIQIRRIIMYSQTPPKFALEVEVDGKVIRVQIGGMENLSKWNSFSIAIANATMKWPPPMTRERWNNVVLPAILDACEEESTGEDGTDSGRVNTWLQKYLDFNVPQYDRDEACRFYRPFYYGQHLYISGHALREYIRMHLFETENSKSLAILLKEFGFKPDHISYKRENGSYTSLSLWALSITHPIAVQFLDRNLYDDAERIRAEIARIPRGPGKVSDVDDF